MAECSSLPSALAGRSLEPQPQPQPPGCHSAQRHLLQPLLRGKILPSCKELAHGPCTLPQAHSQTLAVWSLLADGAMWTTQKSDKKTLPPSHWPGTEIVWILILAAAKSQHAAPLAKR